MVIFFLYPNQKEKKQKKIKERKRTKLKPKGNLHKYVRGSLILPPRDGELECGT